MKTQTILAIAFLLFLVIGSCQKNEQASTGQQVEESENIATRDDGASAIREDMKIMEPSGDNMGVATLPNAIQIEIPAGSLEEKLVKALAAKTPKKEMQFVFDGLVFNENQTLNEESYFQLQNRQILEAFPEKSWKIMSYYFENADPDKNQEISGKKLESMKQYLGDNGADLGHIEWVALGSSNPGDDTSGSEADKSRIVLATQP
ncbi:MAG: hypothetical protein R3B47_00390 [Bacteroidia bacterium]